jgi:pimeloyl-ACP methyl ester carboxylesterase
MIVRTHDGIELHCRVDDHTDPWTDPPWIVLQHGVAESLAAWFAWMPHLTRHYRVLRYDMRGFGDSTPMPRDHRWSLATLRDDLNAVVDAHGVTRFHLVAAKVGGTVALDYAAHESPRLRSLTVLGAPIEGASSRKVGYSSQEIVDHGVEHWARRTMHNRLGTRMPAAAHDWWGTMMGRTAASTQAGFLDFLPTVDVGPTLSRIACPVLVVTTGAAGNAAQSITDLSLVRSWASTIPRARVLVVPNDSFHVAATDPDVAAEATLDFVGRVDRGEPID